MSRINIIIGGLLTSIFLIFLCISLNAEKYYKELNPQKIKTPIKRLKPKPTIPLKDRQKKMVEPKTIQPMCNAVIREDINLTLSKSKKNLFLIDGGKKNILLEPIEEKNSEKVIDIPSDNQSSIYPISDYNNSNRTLHTIESNISNLSKSPLDVIQQKISALLHDRQITFKRNRGDISPEGRDVLDEIYTLLSEKDGFIIEVQGHTDAGGKRKINQWISQKRANRVKRYLVNRGIAPENIKTQGFGESRLLFKDRPYNQKNRRVEIYIKEIINDRLND